MNKKVVLFCAIFAFLLLAAIGYVSYNLFFSDRGKVNVDNDSRIDVLEAVPTDAIVVYNLKNSSTLISLNDPFRQFLTKLPEEFKECSSLFSLHYSSKNQISPLFVLSLPTGVDNKEVAEMVEKECSGVSHKRYGANIIYSSILPKITFAVYNHYLIASTSIFVLESSLRHLEGNTSILDNALFNQIAAKETGNTSLIVNNQNIGKLFSGALNSDYLRYANFATFFSSALMLNLDGGSNYMFGEGSLFNTKDEANFSNIFLSQKSRESTICKILPNTTNYLVTIPLYSDEAYLQSYSSYLEARKRSYSPDTKLKDWFLSLEVSEMAVASITIGDITEKLLFMRSEKCNDFQMKSGLPNLIGKMFAPTKNESFLTISDWIVVGGSKMLELYAENQKSETFFSFEDYLLQTPAAACCKGLSNLSVLLNIDRLKDSLSLVFKEQYSKPIIKGVLEHNFNFAAVKLVSEQGKLNVKSTLIFDNLSQLPVPKQLSESAFQNEEPLVDQTPIVVPKGPFKIKNFINGKTNYIEQMPNNMLRLLDDQKKGIWTIPFDKPLCGYVNQLDYFKNGKLQMLFGAGSKIFLLDRLGRWVSPFPIDLKREIALGPALYDFKGNRNYSLMVLHTDNKIVMYDINGKVVKGWIQMTSKEKIKSLPELLKMESGNYWILRTAYQTLIFDANGAIVADFSKKKRLKPDCVVEKKSNKEVIVTTIENKKMVLNLIDGTFKNHK